MTESQIILAIILGTIWLGCGLVAYRIEPKRGLKTSIHEGPVGLLVLVWRDRR